jgi:thiamine-monophosphate kinase
MTFTPRVQEARELASRYRITAMIDLSDGLSRDLAHICRESDVGAVVSAGSLPVHEDVKVQGEFGYEYALRDGEDYELLFTSPNDVEHPLVTRVGTITAERGLFLQKADGRRRLDEGGWEHLL